MRVKLLTVSAGPGGCRQPGVYDLPEAEAKDLLKGGYAVPVAPRVERATIVPTETRAETPPPGDSKVAEPRKGGGGGEGSGEEANTPDGTSGSGKPATPAKPKRGRKPGKKPGKK